MLGGVLFQMPGSALGSITAKHKYWSGTSSNATPTTPHSQLNTHFELTALDLLSTNLKSNHNSPLTPNYKYDK